jgi:hypothetical protein
MAEHDFRRVRGGRRIEASIDGDYAVVPDAPFRRPRRFSRRWFEFGEGAWFGSVPSVSRRRPWQTGQTPVSLPRRSKSWLPGMAILPVPTQLPCGAATVIRVALPQVDGAWPGQRSTRWERFRWRYELRDLDSVAVHGCDQNGVESPSDPAGDPYAGSGKRGVNDEKRAARRR